MAQLRQLDLQPALLSLCATGKNRQNQPYPVQHAALQLLFEVALLRRCQFVVEYDQIDTVSRNIRRQLFNLARTDKQRRMRAVAFGGFHKDGIAAGRFDQLHRFCQCRLKSAQTGGAAARSFLIQHHAHQHDAFRLRLSGTVPSCSA